MAFAPRSRSMFADRLKRGRARTKSDKVVMSHHPFRGECRVTWRHLWPQGV